MQRLDPTDQVHRVVFGVFGLCILMLGDISHARGASPGAFGPCEPGFVERWPSRLPVLLASTSPPVASANNPVLLEWLGHSSFLLTSPEGLRLLTDPNGYHPVRVTPDVVTVSNLHATHRDVSFIPASAQVLWGITPNGDWQAIALTFKDVSLFNVPSHLSRTEPESSPIQNSMFVFRIGGLCIVHLGNLRHPLTTRQLQRLGKPDVVMIPADGQWTLGYDDIVTVITQLQPHLVIPMHMDFPQHAELLVQYTAGRYPVRRIAGSTLPLSRSMLPVGPELVVFTAP